MTKDYLDLARLESRRVRMERQPVESGTALVAEVVEVAVPRRRARQIRIETELAPDVPPAGELRSGVIRTG
jgi:signal transduction histidine kinase